MIGCERRNLLTWFHFISLHKRITSYAQFAEAKNSCSGGRTLGNQRLPREFPNIFPLYHYINHFDWITHSCNKPMEDSTMQRKNSKKCAKLLQIWPNSIVTRFQYPFMFQAERLRRMKCTPPKSSSKELPSLLVQLRYCLSLPLFFAYLLFQKEALAKKQVKKFSSLPELFSLSLKQQRSIVMRNSTG